MDASVLTNRCKCPKHERQIVYKILGALNLACFRTCSTRQPSVFRGIDAGGNFASKLLEPLYNHHLALNHTPSKPTPTHPQPLSISPITYLFLHPLYLSTLYTTYYMSSTYATPYYSSLIVCPPLYSFWVPTILTVRRLRCIHPAFFFKTSIGVIRLYHVQITPTDIPLEFTISIFVDHPYPPSITL